MVLGVGKGVPCNRSLLVCALYRHTAHKAQQEFILVARKAFLRLIIESKSYFTKTLEGQNKAHRMKMDCRADRGSLT